MEPLYLFLALLPLLFTPVSAVPSYFTLSPYAPTIAHCPSQPLVRQANGLSSGENGYRLKRAAKASENLHSWIRKLNAGRTANDTFSTTNMPVLGLASSGGAIRALLSGAGVIQELDGRDSVNGGSLMKGLYQGITYHTGSSTGAWLVAALAGNDGATVTSLHRNIWDTSFEDTIFRPKNIRSGQFYAETAMSLVAKTLAGFSPTLIDGYGRLLSYQILLSNPPGLNQTLSALLQNRDFQSADAPYPIFTALGLDPSDGLFSCIYANADSPQFEFHPYEFGSWEASLRAFSPTAFMGTAVNNGFPLSKSSCINGFDNLGFLVGSSSNQFNYFCSVVPSSNLLSGQLGDVQTEIIAMTSVVHPVTYFDEYGAVPNPFYGGHGSSSAAESIYLVDGSQGGENIPLWPLIQPERQLDVIIVNDNSGDTAETYPNGSSLYKAYRRARRMGVKTMPEIPPAEIFVARRLNKRPTFFGCFTASQITIIYLPNTDYTFPSNISDWDLQYSRSEVNSMLSNGNMVATMGGNQTWPYCVACALLLKASTGQMPVGCAECLDEFCFN